MKDVVSITASHQVWNSANIWYTINKNPNNAKADSKMFNKILPAFLKLFPFQPSVIYKYHATITIITISTQYIYPNTFATLIMKSDAFAIKLLLSAAR